ncbi:MAG TPA: 1-phosphofructokinase family hexose kinase [Micromonosporaceae bacterium]|nr:1-phosphofructokinase family hexose kinase [Micromonosporaceae bacterium]
MILTLTPNPAVDLTYHLPTLRVGQVNRVGTVTRRPGGKGVNVARILAAHGFPVLALGPAGGATGDEVRSLLDAAGVAHDLTPVGGATRRTVVVAAADAATGLWEPGPVLSAAEWAAVRDTYVEALRSADVAVLSGSLPAGVPADAYRDLVTAARAAGTPVILDADGEALRHGVAAGPTAIKPNAEELAALTGCPVTGVATATAAAAAACALGAGDVVVSLGPGGLVAVTADGVWSAAPPGMFSGNATGAGDAAVAALAVGLRDGDAWPDRLARMVAWSAAAAAAPVAGEFADTTAAEIAAGVVVRRMNA